MIRPYGWRAALAIVLVGVALVVAAVLVLWLAIAAGLLIALALLNAFYIPRLAARLAIGRLELATGLLAVLGLAGWALSGDPIGFVWGAAAWAVLVAAPQLAISYLERRLRARTALWIRDASRDDDRPVLPG